MIQTSFNTYQQGQRRRVSATFQVLDTPASPVDPDNIYLSIRTPDKEVITYTYDDADSPIIRDSQGNYHADFTLDQGGTWYYRWYSTSPEITAAEQFFEVEPAQAI